MILNSKVLNKIINNNIIKEKYPEIDTIKSHVEWDGDEKYPLYEVKLQIYLKNNNIKNFSDMVSSNFNPHELLNNDLIPIFKIAGIQMREITQIFVNVISKDGEIIY